MDCFFGLIIIDIIGSAYRELIGYLLIISVTLSRFFLIYSEKEDISYNDKLVIKKKKMFISMITICMSLLIVSFVLYQSFAIPKYIMLPFLITVCAIFVVFDLLLFLLKRKKTNNNLQQLY